VIAARAGHCIVDAAMKWLLAAAAAAMLVTPFALAGARPMLHDPVALNIGVVCQWQARCIARQSAAMRRALNYVAKRRPPQWRIQLCNRNAGRSGYRVDWIGFDNCIRNAALRAPSRTGRRR
jgi:hypothetical protein